MTHQVAHQHLHYVIVYLYHLSYYSINNYYDQSAIDPNRRLRYSR